MASVTESSPLEIRLELNLAGQKDAKGLAYSPSARYLALCCADGHVQLYAPAASEGEPILTLKPHESTVWSACFAPTEFGTILATCSSDKTVVIQKENPVLHEWQTLFIDKDNSSIVRSVEFVKSPGAPLNSMQSVAATFAGLHLAAACLDGSVSVYSLQTNHEWLKTKFHAHVGAANIARWCPLTTYEVPNPGTDADPGYLLATGGQDGVINIYRYSSASPSGPTYVQQEQLIGHRRAILDLAWMPPNDLREEKIASLADDGSVIIWTRASSGSQWIQQNIRLRIAPGACHLGWNFDGTNIAVSLKEGHSPILIM